MKLPSKDVIKLIQNMLHPDPKKRIKIESIKEHAWFKGEILPYEQVFEEMSLRHTQITLQKLGI